MVKLNLKKAVSIFIVPTLFIAILLVYFGSEGHAQGPKQFDLGYSILHIDKVEYFLSPTYENIPDIFQVVVRLTNKAGENNPFDASGEFTFMGASGKEYLIPDHTVNKLAPFNLKYLKMEQKAANKLMRDAANQGLSHNSEIPPAGVYRWGFGTQIDQNDKIVAIIYRNGDKVETLSIANIEPVVYSRPTTKPIEGQ